MSVLSNMVSYGWVLTISAYLQYRSSGSGLGGVLGGYDSGVFSGLATYVFAHSYMAPLLRRRFGSERKNRRIINSSTEHLHRKLLNHEKLW